jgi:hypothetical protein
MAASIVAVGGAEWTGTASNTAPVAESSPTSPAAAVRFDAAADALSRTTGLPSASSFTMMGWFRIIADTTTYSSFFSLGNASTNTNMYRLMRCCGNGWQEADLYTGASSGVAGRLSNPIGAWYHLAVVVEGTGAGQVKTYINGVLKLTTAGNPAVPTEKFFIGNDSRGMWFNGSAAAVKLYDGPLTQTEIAAEMQSFAPARTSGLNAFYPLQAAATATTDTSGNGRTLTLGGTLASDPAGPPLTVSTPLSTPEDTPLSGSVRATDIDGDPLTYAIVANATKGTVTITNPATGAFLYVPNADATGSDAFTFKANDGVADSNVATIAIAISPVNDPPVAVNGSATVPAGTSVDSTLISTDVDSPVRTYSIVTNGTKGTATILNAATGAFRYTASSVVGTDSFTFRVNDGSANSNLATVAISITPSPYPVPQNGSLSITEDTGGSGTVSGTDPNALPLTYAIARNGAKGTAVITNAATGAYTYTPARDATGSDTFTFRASNGTYTSVEGLVSVTIAAVNDAPVALAATTTVDAATTVSGRLAATDVDSTALTFSLVANGAKGVATLNPLTGDFTYTANVRSSGIDTFSFQVNDGSLDSNVAVVTVNITVPPNRAPVAQGNAAAASAVSFNAISDVLRRTANLPPVGGFTMMGWFRILADTTSYSTFLAMGGNNGSTNTYRLLRCCGNGWQELDVMTGASSGVAGKLSTPSGAWYHIALTVSGSGTGHVKAYLNGVLKSTVDGNPATLAQEFSIGNDSRNIWFNGSAADVKLYDAPLTASEIVQEMGRFEPVRTANLNAFYPLQSAAQSTLDFSGNNRSLALGGTLDNDPNGPPILASVPLAATEDTPLTGVLQASDLDGDPLTYSIVTQPAKGTVTIDDPATGAFTYTPALDVSGIDQFAYKVNDGSLDSNVVTVYVVIAPVNDSPISQDGSAQVLSGATVTGMLQATDVDSSQLTFSIVANGSKGTATLTNPATGAYAYTANGITSGADTFAFRATDDSGAISNTGTVTVAITLSPAPLASAATVNGTEDTPAGGRLSGADPNGLPLTFSILTNGTRGTAVIVNAATGDFVYTPAANANGTDSFTFRVSNGAYVSNSATVTVNVAPVNDAPVAVNGTAVVNAGRGVNGRLFATDIDSTNRTYRVVASPSQGTVTVDGISGNYTYSAPADASGTDTFSFVANDGSLDSNVATITVTITTGTPANTAPVALSIGAAPSSTRFSSIGDELSSVVRLPSVSSFTIMGWFRYLGDTNSYSSFFRLGHATSSNGYNMLRCCGGGWRELDLWDGTGSRVVLSKLTLGAWYHLALTVNGTGPGAVKTYVNGSLLLTSNPNPNITADRFSIGNDAHHEWLDGNAAAVKVYDVPLSQGEIALEMNRLEPVRVTDLNSWYPLQSADQAAYDFSGQNRMLTQTGGLTSDVAGPPIQTSLVTPRNTSVSGRLLASDAENDPLTFSLTTAPPNGTVVVNPDGTFTYTPATGFVGNDTFTFTVSDGLATSSATVTITIVQ